MLGKDKIAICAILPALKMGAGKTMPEKWQNDREFSRAGFLPCKMAGNFSALAFCHAKWLGIFPFCLFAVQMDWELFRATILQRKCESHIATWFSDNSKRYDVSMHRNFSRKCHGE